MTSSAFGTHMTYEKAAAYIYDIPKFTKKNDIRHTEAFLDFLGNPQDHLKVIHVAGTNGKAPFGGKTDGAFYFSASYQAQRADRSGRGTSQRCVI